LLQARALAEGLDSQGGIAEVDYLLEIANLLERRARKLPMLPQGLEAQIAILTASNRQLLLRSASYIHTGLTHPDTPPALDAKLYDPEFTQSVLKLLLQQN
jgi:hypothetical protein